MFASILTIFVVAFVVGVGLGLGATVGDRKKLDDAEKELAALRSALKEKQLEAEISEKLHQKRIAVAYSVVLDYETVFDELRKRRHVTGSAVILPFRSSSER